MSRCPLPAALQGTSDPDQGLPPFVSQSSWEEQALGPHDRALMAKTFADRAGVFVLDDLTFPKLPQGRHALGGCAAPVLWRVGQEGPRPGRRLAALHRCQRPRAAGAASVPARRLAGNARAAGQGGRARGGTTPARWHLAFYTARATPPDSSAGSEESCLDQPTSYPLEARSSAILVTQPPGCAPTARM